MNGFKTDIKNTEPL